MRQCGSSEPQAPGPLFQCRIPVEVCSLQEEAKILFRSSVAEN